MSELLDALKQVEPFVWEVPRTFRSDMQVPARVYTDAEAIPQLAAESSLEQLVNVATLPGAERYALAMPDVHQGYGFPVGGVAALRTRDGVISPGGIGYDINCGVRLLVAECPASDIAGFLDDFATQIQRDVPSGVGKAGPFELSIAELDRVLEEGIDWAVRRGYADEADREAIEERGRFKTANPEAITQGAKERGRGQLGTIGSGNHFVEVQEIEQIFDEKIAAAYGLFPGQLCVMVHTGSRGLGHQTCTDYVRQMGTVMSEFGITVPDRELACAPFDSPQGRSYFAAMAAAANFAWVNRQLITHSIREAFVRSARGRVPTSLRLLYDVSHNIAKVEHHGGEELVVHRKGATRSFGPDSPEIPEWCRAVGQPVLIPGSMGTASYVLAGAPGAMSDTFGTCCHGAGRRLSRMRAKKTLDYNKLLEQLRSRGVLVRGATARGLLEEAPQAYKDVDAVVRTVVESGIAKLAARLVPRAVVKG